MGLSMIKATKTIQFLGYPHTSIASWIPNQDVAVYAPAERVRGPARIAWGVGKPGPGIEWWIDLWLTWFLALKTSGKTIENGSKNWS
jgi:hypothetical protein